MFAKIPYVRIIIRAWGIWPQDQMKHSGDNNQKMWSRSKSSLRSNARFGTTNWFDVCHSLL